MRNHRFLNVTIALVLVGCSAKAAKPDPDNSAQCIAAFSFIIYKAKGLPAAHDPRLSIFRTAAAFQMYKLKKAGRSDEGRQESADFTRQIMTTKPDTFYDIGMACLKVTLADPSYPKFAQDFPEWERMSNQH